MENINRERVTEIANRTIRGVLAEEKPNNFLHEYVNFSENNRNMRSISVNNIKKIIEKHSTYGCLLISACRSASYYGIDKEKHEADFNRINIVRTRELIHSLERAGFSYIPVYGKFIENEGEGNEGVLYVRSIIVYCQNRKIKELVKFGVEMGEEFDQDAILVQAPGRCPKYISTRAERLGEVDRELPNVMTIYDLCKEYFCELHGADMDKGKSTRVRFYDAYINPAPELGSREDICSARYGSELFK